MHALRRQLATPLPILVLLLAVLPVFVILALVDYGFQARLNLGHWPVFGSPDPPVIGGWLQRGALGLGLVGCPAATLLAVCLAVAGRIRSRDFPFWTLFITTLAALALFFVYWLMDPGGLLNWFFD